MGPENTRLRAVRLAASIAFLTASSASAATSLWPEAESAARTTPMVSAVDAAASGGAYIHVPTATTQGTPPSAGIATFSFSVPSAGTFKVWGRLIAPADTDDSFYVRMDGGAWTNWNNIPLGAAWHWDDVHDSGSVGTAVTYALAAGAHTLAIAYREDGAKLDRVLITDDLGFVPTGTGPSDDPTPTPTPNGSSVNLTPGATITASTHDGNTPANAVDGNLTTRWSANGDGQWLRLDLGSAVSVDLVKVAVYAGNTRANKFELQVSGDNATWTTVFNGQSNTTTTGLQPFDFADQTARYVRYLGHGNTDATKGTWNSVSEIEVWGSTCTDCPTPTATPTPTPTATNGPNPPTPTPTPTPVSPAGWTLRWTGDPSRGMATFEGVEDDRSSSHTSYGPHIRAVGNLFQWDMHMVDRDGSDRQRHEVKGMNAPGEGDIQILQGETWRMTWDMYIPSSMTGGSRFNHIHQQKMVSDAGSSGGPVLTLSTAGGNTLVPRVVGGFSSIPLSQVWNKWIEIDFEYKFDFSSNGGYVRWIVRLNGQVITDQRKTGNVWANEGTRDRRVRPKWGIYRSLESDGMKDCFLQIRNMKAYKKQ